MEEKNATPELTVLAQVVQPNHANPSGNVHGGEIMKMMDNAAGVASQKHARTNVVTARVDELCFHRPVYVGNLVTCNAQVIYTGSSSMEVFVTVEVEDLYQGNGPQIALTAFFTMVSLDKTGRPAKVQPVMPGADPYSMKLYHEGEKRYLARKKRIRI